MNEKCVPLTMGSPRFRSLDVGPFNVVEAWFPASLELPPHLHERPTFAVMLNGSFDVRFERKSYPCGPSTVFTEPLGDKHGNKIGPQTAHVLVLQPDHARSDLFDPCKSLLEEVNHFEHGGLRSLAWRLAYELRTPDATSRIAMQGLGLEMLALASRLYIPASGTDRPAWLERAEDMIRSAALSGVDVEEVSREVDVHPTHLARTFRRHHRQSIGSFVRGLRVEWAAERLLGSDEPITQIALEAGFSDQSHFTRIFKQKMGISPGRYRRRVRV